LTRHLIASEFLGPNAVYSQLLRWKRKPLWLGTAKSKIFRVPKRPIIPLEEAEEIKRLYNEYRTYRESIRRYFMSEVEKNAVQYDEETVRKAEDEDFERCFLLNEEWNKEMAIIREERHAEQLQKRKDKVLKNLIAKEERDKKLMAKIEEKVRIAKAEAATFITAENIDQAIEEALANIVNLNVAIDAEGNRYEGKYEPPAAEKPQKRRLQAEQ